MNNKEFEFLITSPFDRERLVCEIYYQSKLLAEISQEGTEMLIEIDPHKNSKWWQISLPKLQEALENAKKHLLGNSDLLKNSYARRDILRKRRLRPRLI